LVSETGHSSGLYKLFEEFDVIPAYMNKKELKILFELISTSQVLPLSTVLSLASFPSPSLLSLWPVTLRTSPRQLRVIARQRGFGVRVLPEALDDGCDALPLQDPRL
jgi:hypothetical protein